MNGVNILKFLFLFYIGFDKHGPSVHTMTDIVEQCLARGHEVEMIVRNRGGDWPDTPQKLQGYKKLTCHVIRDADLERSALIKRYIEDIGYAFKCKKIYRHMRGVDAVFLQSCTSPLFPVALVRRFIKKPILFNVQNIFPLDAMFLGALPGRGIKSLPFRVLRAMQRMAYRRSDAIVTISDDMKELLIEEKVQPDKLSVVYNWSYSDEAYDIPESENLFLRAHRPDPSQFRVVFAGNLGSMVNARLIADAAEMVACEEKIHFHIIGAGNNMPRLKQMAEEKGLRNMSFYPYQPEEFATHNYAMAHLNINALPKGIVYTCMPSKTATLLNCARPMLMSFEKTSHLAAMMESVDKCTVVDVDDVQGFADAILANYRNHVVDNSTNARDVFAKMCSKENAKRYAETLESLAERK